MAQTLTTPGGVTGGNPVTPPRARRFARGGRGPAGGRRRWIQPEYFAVPIALVLLWELAVQTGVLDARTVPAPHTVVTTWWTWIVGDGLPGQGRYDGTWAEAAVASGSRVLMGFAIAGVVGTTVGLMIGWFRLPRVLLQPVVDILRPVPVTAWVPFAVVFFGIQPAASISLIALGTFFPIALNAASGAVGTPRVLVSAAQMMGTRPTMILWRVVLPSALPSIVTGLRTGLALGWVLVIVSEMVAVKSGLGFSLWDAYYFGQMDVIVAAMFSVGILGFLSDRALAAASSRVLKWAPDVR